MTKINTSEKHLNSVLRKDGYAIESNKEQLDRQWAIKKLKEIKKI